MLAVGRDVGGGSSTGYFGSIDLSTAVFTQIGADDLDYTLFYPRALAFNPSNGLAYCVARVRYTQSTHFQVLMTISADGAVTEILNEAFVSDLAEVEGLAWNPNALQLLAVAHDNSDNGRLLRIDPQTGAMTRIGTTDAFGIADFDRPLGLTVMALDGSGGGTPAAAFDWRFDTLIALETYFDVTLGSSNGQWEFESGGSTGSGNTGPSPNNNDPFVHTEASSNNGESSMETNSPAVALADSNDVLHDRDIVIRYAFTSNQASTTRALLFQGRATGGAAWTTIATLYAWAYAATRNEGDTVTDINGDDFTVALDGGWRDVTVSTGDYDEYQLFVDYDGSSLRQDMALYSISSA